jgi:hypothetical protein
MASGILATVHKKSATHRVAILALPQVVAFDLTNRPRMPVQLRGRVSWGGSPELLQVSRPNC